MERQPFFQHIQTLIAQNELKKALQLLRSLLENTPLLNDVLQQSGRLAQIQHAFNLGTISHPEAATEQNRIRYAVLDLVQQLSAQSAPPQALRELLKAVETESARPELQEEIATAKAKVITISNSQNVVVDSSLNAQNLHIGNIIYQNAPPTAEAPRPFNLIITRKIVEAMRPFHENAARLCNDLSWLDQPDNLRKVQQFVFRNFIGEVGKQLRSLVNIGAAEQLEGTKKQQHYSQKCLQIANRALDLVNFTLLSVWWETVKTAPRPLTEPQKKVLTHFFDKDLETGIAAQLELLRTLLDLFQQHAIPLPFDDLESLRQRVAAPDNPLKDVCLRLEAAAAKHDCDQTESLLGDFLHDFAFLSLYRMASIKNIRYRQLRNGVPQFQHRYVALGIDIKYSEDAEKERWTTAGEQVPAVLLYRGEDYQNGISLFPFIIDYNALTFEQGAKICFFNAKELDNPNLLEYLFLGDNSAVRIVKQSANRIDDDKIMDKEDLKTLNLNCVVDIFQEARTAILGTSTHFFDQL